jgi:hypothetical protein
MLLREYQPNEVEFMYSSPVHFNFFFPPRYQQHIIIIHLLHLQYFFLLLFTTLNWLLFLLLYARLRPVNNNSSRRGVSRSSTKTSLSSAPYPHVMVFSVIFLISWSGLSSLVDTHTAHRGAKGERRIIRKKTRPKYMRVVLLYRQYICSGISLISFCCFSSSFFFLSLYLALIEIAHLFLLSLSLSLYHPKTRLVPNDLFISIRHFVCSNSLLRSFQNAIHFYAVPYISCIYVAV